jgi:hypothetical protein
MRLAEKLFWKGLMNTTGEISGFCCDMVIEASALQGCYIVQEAGSRLRMSWYKKMVRHSMVKQSMMLFGLLDHWSKRLQPLYFTYINLILMVKTCVPLCPNRNLSYPTTSSIYGLQVMTLRDIKAVACVQQLLPDLITYNCNTITESCIYFGSAIHCGPQQRKF